MVKLSVNVNKIALLRNARGREVPSLKKACQVILENGADGITVHPRPDLRHIKPDDVLMLAKFCLQLGAEFNIEGNPFSKKKGEYPGFIELVKQAKPTQVTLVPDAENQITSDHGWELGKHELALRGFLSELRSSCKRISLFMSHTSKDWNLARQLGADRVELYTQNYAQSYAAHYASSKKEGLLKQYLLAAKLAAAAGLQVNAGHDLNQENLAEFLAQIPFISEVSIGHALINDALYDGLAKTVRSYKRISQSLGDAGRKTL